MTRTVMLPWALTPEMIRSELRRVMTVPSIDEIRPQPAWFNARGYWVLQTQEAQSVGTTAELEWLFEQIRSVNGFVNDV